MGDSEPKRICLVQEGGNSPGYNTVTAFLVEQLGRRGHAVWVAREGFRSLVEPAFLRLYFDDESAVKPEFFEEPSFNARFLLDTRGAAFRSERYPQFKNEKTQKVASATVIAQGFSVVIVMGGNGSAEGVKGLQRLLPARIRCFFVPVTLDSDIAHTECIGQHTAAEVGSERVRRLVADAATHRRTYVVEMMGSESGFHAVHSCIGGGAHYAVSTEPLVQKSLRDLAEAISKRRSTVLIVAAGYASSERQAEAERNVRAETGVKAISFTDGGRREYFGVQGAAEYLCRQLVHTGALASIKVVTESWSRDLRGALPNNVDTFLSQVMAREIARLVDTDANPAMVTVLNGSVDSVPLADIATDNSVDLRLIALANSL